MTTPKKPYTKFQDPKSTFENPPFVQQKIAYWGDSKICYELGAHARFQNPGTTPSGIKITLEQEEEREKRRRNLGLNWGQP